MENVCFIFVSFYRSVCLPVCLPACLSASLRALLFAHDHSSYLMLRVLADASFHHASMPVFLPLSAPLLPASLVASLSSLILSASLLSSFSGALFASHSFCHFLLLILFCSLSASHLSFLSASHPVFLPLISTCLSGCLRGCLPFYLVAYPPAVCCDNSFCHHFILFA